MVKGRETPLAIAVLAAGLSLASPALAFCRATTCDDTQETCRRDAHLCLIDGKPLAWPEGTVSVWVDPAGSPLRKITGEQTAGVLARAFAQWMSAASTDGAKSGLEATVLSGAEAPPAGVQGTVVFRDASWPYDPSFGALTHLTFDIDTGDLLEAKTEINSATHALALNPTGSQVDLDAVLTHEMGHVIGLAHSDVTGATMVPETRAFGSVDLASLAPDDENGVTTIYPRGAGATSNDGVAVDGSGASCSYTRRAPSSGGSLAFLALAFGALRVRRRG